MSKSGVYKITNIVNNKIYVGSAVNLVKRKNNHFSALRLNKHTNNKLQNSYNKHSEELFVFEVLETVEDLKLLVKTEQKYIDELKPFYNIVPIAGSQLGFKHSLASRKKMSDRLIEEYANTDKRNKMKESAILQYQQLGYSEKLQEARNKWFSNIENIKSISGENNVNSKVTILQINGIKFLREKGFTVQKIADLYTLSKGYISRVCSGKYRKHG